MQGSRFVLQHVGGRWGNHPFPIPERFAADFTIVLYEADADAIGGIYQATAHLPSEVIVAPICLAEADGQKTLYVSINPGCTSLLQPGSAWDDAYAHVRGIDYDCPDGARVIEHRTIEARSLDSLLASSQRYPLPDFLTLDVQGYEYEVVEGARHTLTSSVCGLIVESAFVKLYRDQKRFQDLCDFLDDLGFSFIRFMHLGELSRPPRAARIPVSRLPNVGGRVVSTPPWSPCCRKRIDKDTEETLFMRRCL